MEKGAVVLVHGGAGDIKDEERAKEVIKGVKAAALIGYKQLQSSGSILDAVEQAVRSMEDNEHFNAGKGSVVNVEGEVEMDASIMVGADLSAGAVTIVKDVKNPITLARRIMECTEHVMLGAEGARRFAIDQGLELVPPGALVTQKRLHDLKELKKGGSEMGTVGAVAACCGKVVAATSTGGREGKMVGRSSDTSCLGSGTLADDASGAVSTTGHGETILKYTLASKILQLIEGGCDAQSATTQALNAMTAKLKNTAGAITVTPRGDVGIDFTSRRMSWAYVQDGKLHFGLDHNEHNIEEIRVD